MHALKLKSVTLNVGNYQIVYQLIFKNALYSFECYKQGYDRNGLLNYCYIENVAEDEGDAEYIFHALAKGEVFPVHIKDMVEDMILN